MIKICPKLKMFTPRERIWLLEMVDSQIVPVNTKKGG